MRINLYYFCLFFLLLFPYNSKAIELMLEENKAESGTIGYVDIEKVFEKYSIKSQTREDFLNRIKEKENIIYSKKEEINNIKNQILKLKQEKDLAISLEQILKSAKENDEQNLTIDKSSDVVISSNTYLNIDSSTPNVIKSSATITENKSTQTIKSADINIFNDIGIVNSSYTAEGKIPVLNMPGVGNIPLTHFKFSVSTSAVDIDKIISEKEKEVNKKEEELKELRKKFDKELLEYENNQTEKILGEIYIKIKELSIREGVSVVVDKKSILFGHKAVDLTDKLIMELENEK